QTPNDSYEEIRQQYNALNVLWDILLQKDFISLIQKLPEKIADIFQATASIFLIDPKSNGQDAFVIQGSSNSKIKHLIGWIHYLDKDGVQGWVGETARRLSNMMLLAESSTNKINIPYPPKHPKIDFPYHFLPAPMLTPTYEPLGVLWLSRPHN